MIKRTTSTGKQLVPISGRAGETIKRGRRLQRAKCEVLCCLQLEPLVKFDIWKNKTRRDKKADDVCAQYEEGA